MAAEGGTAPWVGSEAMARDLGGLVMLARVGLVYSCTMDASAIIEGNITVRRTLVVRE